jgi:hypothetical protein
MCELNGIHGCHILEQGLADSMHPIHYSTRSGQDDGIGQVSFLDQLRMNRDSPTRRGFVTKPETLIKLVDTRQRNLLYRIVTDELNQSVHVPNQSMPTNKLRMVLSPHQSFLLAGSARCCTDAAVAPSVGRTYCRCENARDDAGVFASVAGARVGRFAKDRSRAVTAPPAAATPASSSGCPSRRGRRP